MTGSENNYQGREASIHALAAVGFVALVACGIWLAVYSSQFVPAAMTRIGEAAVAVAGYFTPAPSSKLSVVPSASTTLPFSEATSTPTTPTAPAKKKPAAPITPTAGKETTRTVQMSGATTTSRFYGLPDFITTINAVGYLATSSATSFVASSTVPVGSRPAVRFTIKNIGTNTTGPWCFSASIPTQTAYIYHSLPQQSLNPGDSIQYTLGFDQANKGSDQTISITANTVNTPYMTNCGSAVAESNTTNDSASTKLTILGS